MMLELYILLFVTGMALFILGFAEGVKHPLYSLTAMLIFALLTYASFDIHLHSQFLPANVTANNTSIVIQYGSIQYTYGITVQGSTAIQYESMRAIETPLAYLNVLLAVVSFVQFFYLVWDKLRETMKEEVRSSGRLP